MGQDGMLPERIARDVFLIKDRKEAARRSKEVGIAVAQRASRTDLTPQSIKFFVRKGVSVMAPFRKTEITDADLDALAAYLSRKPK